MKKSSVYIRTEPPALLTEPVTVTLRGDALRFLNQFRQASYELYSLPVGSPERQALTEAQEQAAWYLATDLSSLIKAERGEPADWADAEDLTLPRIEAAGDHPARS